MSKLDQIATKIIKEQELIIGPIAWLEASEVKGLHVSGHESVSIENGDGAAIVDSLVGKFEHLFGRASREVCKDAVASLIADLAPSDVPSSLR